MRGGEVGNWRIVKYSISTNEYSKAERLRSVPTTGADSRRIFHLMKSGCVSASHSVGLALHIGIGAVAGVRRHSEQAADEVRTSDLRSGQM